MNKFRKKFVSDLKYILFSNEEIISVWEGGSAATGYLDEMSDLDIGIVCNDDFVESVFVEIEKHLDREYIIENKFRMPEPAWHGHSQCFYKLKKTLPLFYVDLLVMKKSSDNNLVQSDRHGETQIWIDRESLIDTTPTPEEEIEKKCRFFYNLMRDSFDFLVMDLEKQIKRNNLIDAMNLYSKGILGRLAYVLNLKFRPHKYDFGLSYYYRDFPEDIIKLMEDLVFVRNLNDLKIKKDMAIKKFNEVMNELEVKYS